MVYLYTELWEDSSDWILYNDMYFNLFTSNEELTEEDKIIIKSIDNAKVLEDSRIETRFGVGTTRDLSSGCKTYLNAIKNKRKVISAEECGSNVLSLLFTLENVRLFMSHPELFDIKDNTQICFNDTEVVNGRTGYNNWWSEEYVRRCADDL